MAVDVEGLSRFVDAIDGDTAAVRKDILQRIVRDLREGQAARAMVAAGERIGDVCATIRGRQPVVMGLDLGRSA